VSEEPKVTEEPTVTEEPMASEDAGETEDTSTIETKEPSSEAKEEAKEDIAEERECPKCKTMIQKDATTCYACGADLIFNGLEREEGAEEQKAEEDTEQKKEEGFSQGQTNEASIESGTIASENKKEDGEDAVEEGVKEESILDAFIDSEVKEPEEKEEEGEVKLPSKDELYTMSDEQLVALCETLGLDSTGRTKHLRERLLEHIDGGKSEAEEKPQVDMEKKHSCVECGGDLSYIEQYDRWYCYSCERYSKVSKD
jgi:hypothetical protein